jgi:hypothetical protein
MFSTYSVFPQDNLLRQSTEISPLRKLRPGAHIADPCRGKFAASALPEFDHPKAFESLDTNSQSLFYVNMMTIDSNPGLAPSQG